MRTFDVDVFLRRGKHHSAVWQMFGEQPNAIRRLLVHQREFGTIRLCRVDSLPRQMPNNLQIYPHERTHHFHMPRSCSRSDVNPPLGCPQMARLVLGKNQFFKWSLLIDFTRPMSIFLRTSIWWFCDSRLWYLQFTALVFFFKFSFKKKFEERLRSFKKYSRISSKLLDVKNLRKMSDQTCFKRIID